VRQAILTGARCALQQIFPPRFYLSKSFIASSANTPALIVIEADGAFAAMSAHGTMI
jgi:hypothetical protein